MNLKMRKHFFLYELYTIHEASNQSMYILGYFLSDIGNRQDLIFFWQSWPLNQNENDCITTNTTCIEKDNDLIYLTSIVPTDDGYDDTALILSNHQFIQLMKDWEKVLDQRPQEVTITYENNQFTLNM